MSTKDTTDESSTDFDPSSRRAALKARLGGKKHTRATDGGQAIAQGTEASTDETVGQSLAEREYGQLAYEPMNGRIDADVLDLLCRHVTKTVEEVRLRFGRDGWAFKAVDPSNVGMVNVTLNPEAFEAARPPTRDSVVGINLDQQLNGALSDTDADGTVRIEFTDGRAFTLTDEDTGRASGSNLIDPDSVRQAPELPDVELPVMFHVEDGYALKKFFKSAGGHVTITASAAGVSIEEQGDAGYFNALTLGRGDLGATEGLNGAEANHALAKRLSEHTRDFHDGQPLVAQSTYSVDYLADMFGGLKKTQYADAAYRFRLGTEFPLGIERVDEELPGRIAFMLAPRIQSE